MRELLLREEDYFASIGEGGPGCITGQLKHFPLETLLTQAQGYAIKALDTARIHLSDTEESSDFESPIILLHNKETNQPAVCIRTENKFGHITYKLYKYSQEQEHIIE